MFVPRPAALGVVCIFFALVGAPVDAAPKVDDAPRPAGIRPQKPPAPKGKDFVGKAHEKKDRGGLYRFESGAYKITTDVDKDLANDIAAHMDEVYKEYDRRLAGFKPNPFAAVRPNEKMPLFVLRRYRDYLTLLNGYGVNGANSGGVFFRTAQKQSGLATWVEGQSRLKMYYVLQHEGFHQFADARIMFDLPPWVNEGLAEYFGDSIMVRQRLVAGRLDEARLERMKAAIAAKQTLPFKELLTMNGQAWVGRVTGGDKAASLMYDSAWSVCFFLIHGGKRGGALETKIEGRQVPAMEAYLRILNADFVRDPRTDKRPEAFRKVFSDELGNFEKAWKEGLEKLEPDPWFTSVRHLQFVAAALKQFHAEKVELKTWDQLKEEMARRRFRTTIRERDAASVGKDKDADEEQGLDFPSPTEVEFYPDEDTRFPATMLIKNVTPNILLTWSINPTGDVEEEISFIPPPRVPRAPAAKNPDPAQQDRQSASPADTVRETDKPKATQPSSSRKGTIKVGP